MYLSNRIVNSLTKDKTPYELYYSKKPHLGHVRVFGSLAFFKTQEKKRSGYIKKLEARSIKGLLVGYEKNYTYRIFDHATDKIIVTREVKMDESKGYEAISKDGGKTYDHLDVWLGLTPDSDNEDEDVVDDCPEIEGSSVTSPAKTSVENLVSPLSSADDQWEHALEDIAPSPVNQDPESDLPASGPVLRPRPTKRPNYAAFAEALVVYGDISRGDGCSGCKAMENCHG